MLAPTLHLKALQENGVLRIHYEFKNLTTNPLVLLDQLWTVDGSSSIPDKEPAYGSISENGTLKLGRFLHPVPRLRLVEQTIVPFGRVVDPGKQAVGEFVLTEPVREYNPYYDSATRDDEEREIRCDAVTFRVSWLVKDEATRLDDSAIMGCYLVRNPDFKTAAKTLESAPVRIDMRAMRRVDQFERFD